MILCRQRYGFSKTESVFSQNSQNYFQNSRNALIINKIIIAKQIPLICLATQNSLQNARIALS